MSELSLNSEGFKRKEQYRRGEIKYCQWCVETGDWEHHDEHDIVEEHHREQEVYHHVEMIAFNGVCNRCGATADVEGEGCRKA
jgi:hypothetical protein